MEDYNIQNNKFSNNGYSIIEDLLMEIEKLKINRITDSLLLRNLDYFTDQIKRIEITIKNNPRFNWVKIQEEIDRLYKLDNKLIGVYLTIRWGAGNNFAHCNYNLQNE